MNDNTTKTTANTGATIDAGARHDFKAETSRLLHLLIHSVYSEREVFLRELISNAADACEKLRFEANSDPTLLQDDADPLITITIDAAAKQLSVADNGIGMNGAELTDNLGTIARSGTRAFLDKIADAKSGNQSGNQLIGQFGVGFYAAFMVAREVEAISRRAGTPDTHRWRSQGGENFSVATLDADDPDQRSRGTQIRLHLNDDAHDFLNAATIERIVRTYSGHIPVPIALVEINDGKAGEPRRIGDASALWRKPKSEVSKEAYGEFYGHVSGQFDTPALTLHYRAEGRHEYAVLLFIPESRPFDLFDPERRGRVKLYVRRVFITDQADLLPGYLRFMRGVIDSEDMPLNISREMLQQNPLVAQIRKAVTNRVLGELTKLAESGAETFKTIWDNFGAVIKEGLYEDSERRDELYKIARFKTTSHPDGGRSLADYAAAVKENQTAIYYATGDSVAQIMASPQLEGFRARGIEVLLLSDPVDAFWTAAALGYDGKPFRAIAQAGAELAQIALEQGGETPDSAAPADDSDMAMLVALAKQVLGDAVSDVSLSKRLVDSPACLAAPQGGLDRRLARMLARDQGSAMVPAPVLELNGSHALIKALAGLAASKGESAIAAPVWLLFDQARIADGEQPADPAAFCARLTESLVQALS